MPSDDGAPQPQSARKDKAAASSELKRRFIVGFILIVAVMGSLNVYFIAASKGISDKLGDIIEVTFLCNEISNSIQVIPQNLVFYFSDTEKTSPRAAIASAFAYIKANILKLGSLVEGDQGIGILAGLGNVVATLEGSAGDALAAIDRNDLDGELALYRDVGKFAAFLDSAIKELMINELNYDRKLKDSLQLQSARLGASVLILLAIVVLAAFLAAFIYTGRTIASLEGKIRRHSEELEAANSGLSRANAELSASIRELKVMQETLIRSERLSALGKLSAGIAHEFNTPLGAIISSSGSVSAILRDDLPSQLSVVKRLEPGHLELLRTILDECPRGEGTMQREEPSLVDELAHRLEEAGFRNARVMGAKLLDLGASIGGQRIAMIAGMEDPEGFVALASSLGTLIQLNELVAIASQKASTVVKALKGYLGDEHSADFGPVDIAREVQVILTLLGNRIRHSVAVRTEFLHEGLARGNRQQVGQVLINLLNNALEAMDYSGKISISSRNEDGLIRILVADSGPGIHEEIRSRVFEPFFTTKQHGDGLGLGLDITRLIVERHGGTISFESGPTGTVFAFTLMPWEG